MREFGVLLVVAFLQPLSWAGATSGAEAAQAPPAKPRTSITVWDTDRPSAEPLAPPSLAGKEEWTAIPVGKTADSFKGDAVLNNGRIVAVLRKQSSAVEIHAVNRGGAVARLRLRLVTAAGEPAARLEHVALVENTRGSACLEATFQTAGGTEVAGRFRIKRGDVSVQAEPGRAS